MASPKVRKSLKELSVHGKTEREAVYVRTLTEDRQDIGESTVTVVWTDTPRPDPESLVEEQAVPSVVVLSVCGAHPCEFEPLARVIRAKKIIIMNPPSETEARILAIAHVVQCETDNTRVAFLTYNSQKAYVAARAEIISAQNGEKHAK